METIPQFKLWATQFDSSGRVHMPSELRKEMKVSSGSPVVWVRTEAGIVLRPYEDVVSEVQDHFCGIGAATDVWSNSTRTGK
ncbi:MAG: AbrB/MazE/SpoVT family DNA-binding domain-containing protein [Planctomycetaceae bacterium]|nr:AbrB/MazE/SpoVT family DNA-binding domain-containing protein [Planctomycetaceae bacterium]